MKDHFEPPIPLPIIIQLNTIQRGQIVISSQLKTVDDFLDAYKAPKHKTSTNILYCVIYTDGYPALCTFNKDPRQELLDRAFQISPGLGLQVTVAFQEHDRGTEHSSPR